MDKSNEISKLMVLTEDQLAEMFAREASLLGTGMLPPSPAALLAAAHAWIAEHLPKLRDSICTNQPIHTICNTPPGKETRLHLAIAVSETIGHSFTHLPGVSALAVLLVKMGIEKLCEQTWRPRS
jgi:hypothetical protein